MDHVPEVVDALVAHRLGRHETIAAALARGGDGTVDELLARGLRRRHRAPAPRGPLLAVGPPAGAGPGGQGRVRRHAAGEDTIETRWAAA